VIADTVLAKKNENMESDHMWEFFRAIVADDPSIARSNFVDFACPLTETILLGNLAVWAAPKGAADGRSLGDWGEEIDWNTKDLVVSNLASLKTPGIAELIKPVYADGYQLD